MSRKETEEEELRRLERNRVAFEAWLERKREEKKKQLEVERAAQRDQVESRRQLRDAGKLAFQQWLKSKHNEDVMRKRQEAFMDEVDKLKQHDKAKEKQRAKEKFEMWKTQKDFESRLQRENESVLAKTLESPPKEPTPSLPGYVSVWSCDNELAEFIVDKVDRGSHLLSHTSTPHTTT